MTAETREQALNRITALCSEYGITPDEIAAKLKQKPATPKDQTSLIRTLFGYIGGIFIFTGLGSLVSMIWNDIGSAQRVILVFGPGLAAFILGILAHKDARFERATTPLFLVAAFLQPVGIFVFLDEYVSRGSNEQLAVIGVALAMALQQALTFKVLKRTSLLFLAVFFWAAFVGTLMDWLNIEGNLIGLTLGVSLLSLSYWADKTPHRAITPFWYFWGAFFVLLSFFDMMEGTAFELLYLGLNAFLIYVSIRVASRTILFVSVIGLLSYLGYFTAEYFADVIGWPIALIVMGMAMIATGAYALKLNKQIKA